MDWVQVAGYVFKFLGMILDMKAKNELSQEKLDMAIKMLEMPMPPKK